MILLGSRKGHGLPSRAPPAHPTGLAEHPGAAGAAGGRQGAEERWRLSGDSDKPIMRNSFNSCNPWRARTNSTAFVFKLRLTFGSGVKFGVTWCSCVSQREMHRHVTGEVQSTR